MIIGLLADVHRTNQKLDEMGFFRYAGSLIQQNFGESISKGFLVWEIESKTKFDVRFVSLKNPHPFITINLRQDGSFIPTLDIPFEAKLRITSNYDISTQIFKKSADIIKTRFNPESLIVYNKPEKKMNIFGYEDNVGVDNLEDVNYQEKLIKEYLKNYKISNEIENKIFELNKKYDVFLGQIDKISRNVNWSFEKIEWSNLFNYGQNNVINFRNFNGIVGIFR